MADDATGAASPPAAGSHPISIIKQTCPCCLVTKPVSSFPAAPSSTTGTERASFCAKCLCAPAVSQPAGNRMCTRCRTSKPASAFHGAAPRQGRGGLMTAYCRQCKAELCRMMGAKRAAPATDIKACASCQQRNLPIDFYAGAPNGADSDRRCSACAAAARPPKRQRTTAPNEAAGAAPPPRAGPRDPQDLLQTCAKCLLAKDQGALDRRPECRDCCRAAHARRSCRTARRAARREAEPAPALMPSTRPGRALGDVPSGSAKQKRCGTCRALKATAFFGKLASAQDGLRPTCKPCRNEGHRKWRRSRQVREAATDSRGTSSGAPASPKRCSTCEAVKPRSALCRKSRSSDGLNYQTRACIAAYHRDRFEVGEAAASHDPSCGARQAGADGSGWDPSGGAAPPRQSKGSGSHRAATGQLERCDICAEVKPRGAFHRRSIFSRDGHRPICRACQSTLDTRRSDSPRAGAVTASPPATVATAVAVRLPASTPSPHPPRACARSDVASASRSLDLFGCDLRVRTRERHAASARDAPRTPGSDVIAASDSQPRGQAGRRQRRIRADKTTPALALDHAVCGKRDRTRSRRAASACAPGASGSSTSDESWAPDSGARREPRSGRRQVGRATGGASGGTKACSQCAVDKPLCDFNRKGAGRRAECRECQQVARRRWQARRTSRRPAEPSFGSDTDGPGSGSDGPGPRVALPAGVGQKRCWMCGTLKDTTCFAVNALNMDGLRLNCRSCQARYQQPWQDSSQGDISKQVDNIGNGSSSAVVSPGQRTAPNAVMAWHPKPSIRREAATPRGAFHKGGAAAGGRSPRLRPCCRSGPDGRRKGLRVAIESPLPSPPSAAPAVAPSRQARQPAGTARSNEAAPPMAFNRAVRRRQAATQSRRAASALLTNDTSTLTSVGESSAPGSDSGSEARRAAKPRPPVPGAAGAAGGMRSCSCCRVAKQPGDFNGTGRRAECRACQQSAALRRRAGRRVGEARRPADPSAAGDCGSDLAPSFFASDGPAGPPPRAASLVNSGEKHCNSCGLLKDKALLGRQATCQDGPRPSCKRCRTRCPPPGCIAEQGGLEDGSGGAAAAPREHEGEAAHPGVVMFQRKTCTRCRRAKPRVAFDRSSATSDGLQSYCRSCQSTCIQRCNRKLSAAIRTAASPPILAAPPPTPSPRARHPGHPPSDDASPSGALNSSAGGKRARTPARRVVFPRGEGIASASDDCATSDTDSDTEPGGSAKRQRPTPAVAAAAGCGAGAAEGTRGTRSCCGLAQQHSSFRRAGPRGEFGAYAGAARGEPISPPSPTMRIAIRPVDFVPDPGLARTSGPDSAGPAGGSEASLPGVAPCARSRPAGSPCRGGGCPLRDSHDGRRAQSVYPAKPCRVSRANPPNPLPGVPATGAVVCPALDLPMESPAAEKPRLMWEMLETLWAAEDD
eukprot:jgi/Tetstr1/423677/TSEL_014311.t1